MQVKGDLRMTGGGSVKGLRAENVMADPASPYVGQIWYNTVEELYKGFNGTAVIVLAPSDDKTYTHYQNTPSTEWLVMHMLGKKPSVTVEDSAGTVVDAGIEYIDDNSLYIRATNLMSGTAYLN